MKKLSFITGLLGLAMVLASSPASAAPSEHLNWGYQLNASETACPSGKAVLNVVRKVINSLDSGLGSNDFGFVWWAVIEYVQQVEVIETAPNTFCATVKSQGSFESVGGDGPGGSGDLEAGVVGTFQGGATYTFNGTFNPGTQRTKGNIGTFDHGCDPATAGGCVGPGFSKWRSEYFTGVSGVSLPWWGWVYHAGNNGSWVNAISGNSGNITGN